MPSEKAARVILCAEATSSSGRRLQANWDHEMRLKERGHQDKHQGLRHGLFYLPLSARMTSPAASSPLRCAGKLHPPRSTQLQIVK